MTGEDGRRVFLGGGGGIDGKEGRRRMGGLVGGGGRAGARCTQQVVVAQQPNRNPPITRVESDSGQGELTLALKSQGSEHYQVSPGD